MRLLRFTWLVTWIALSAAAFAQSDVQKSFDQLKTLAGSWEGPVDVVPPQPEMSAISPSTSRCA